MEHKGDGIRSILENKMDFKQYISERLRDIDNLEERRVAKAILVEGLGTVIEETERRYDELERRVYDEIEIPNDHYEICSTIIERSFFDATNDTLFPVDQMDLDKQAIRDSQSDKTRLYIGTYYLKADDSSCAKLAEEGKRNGTFLAGGRELPVVYLVEPVKRYRDLIEQLYGLFQANQIPWTTVNTGYLDKFFDVFLLREEGKIENGEIQNSESEAACIDWGDLEGKVFSDCIPLWNIQRIRFSSTDFMLPCGGDIYYEHICPLMNKGSRDGYVIQSNDDILEIRHEAGRIIIKSKKESYKNWTALRISQQESFLPFGYSYPVLTNRKRDSFFRRFAERTQVRLMTKMDLFRRIMEMDVHDYIQIVDYELLTGSDQRQEIQGMNWFIGDELFPMEGRRVLLLKFKRKEGSGYLCETMVRFVVSQMQLEITEYRCVGVIV